MPVLNMDKASYVKNVIPYREVVMAIKESVHFTGQASNDEGGNSMYFRYHSVVTYFPKIFVAHVAEANALEEFHKLGEKIEVQSIENVELLFNNRGTSIVHEPRTNLVVIIVESFESWLIDATDDKNQLVMPYMNNYVHCRANIYCDKITKLIFSCTDLISQKL